MARSRRSRARRRAASSRRSTTPTSAPVTIADVTADRDLLGLAQQVAAIAEGADEAPIRQALEALAAAFAHDGPTARRFFEAWLARTEASALAVAWAREQLRLALEDLVAREAKHGRVRTDVPAATLAWMLLAGAEAMAHEPPGDAAVRIDALLAVIAPAARTIA